MKRWPVILVLLSALVIPRMAEAQVVDISVGAGYSLNNEALRAKGAWSVTWLGFEHGFYVGPQFDFNLGKGFSIRTGLDFRRGGSHLFMDFEKLSVNFNQFSLDVENGSKMLFDYQKENPELDLGGITAEQVTQGMEVYNDLKDDVLEALKGCDLTLNLDRYSLGMPVLLRYTSGKFSVSAGANLRVMLFSKIKMQANLPNGTVYSDKDLSKLLPYAHCVLAEKLPEGENPTMTPELFYRKDVAQYFTVGLQAGIDYAVTDWISLHLNFLYGLRPDIKAPWTDALVLQDRAIQAGVSYHFHYKTKK